MISDIKSIQVYDMLGKQVKQFNTINSNQFNVAYLPVGEYIINVVGQKGEVLSYRLIKE